MDQDNISVSSFTSNASDNNETSSQLDDIDSTVKEEANSQPGAPVQDLDTVGTDHVTAEKNESSGVDHEIPITHDKFIKDENKIIDNEDGNVVEANAEAQEKDETDFGSTNNTKENKDSENSHTDDTSDKITCTAEQDKCDKESKVNSMPSAEKLTAEVSNENSISEKSAIGQTKPYPQISVEECDSILVKSSGTESDTVSTLDKEIARLNSYLSETSECSTSELDSAPQSLSSSTRARKEVESILLKNSQRYQDLEDEITRNFGKNQTEYKESDLDKQLKQLDFEASSSSDLGTVNSPVFSPDTSPSIYTMYKTPSISQDDICGEYYPKSLESESSIGDYNLPPEGKSSGSLTDSVHVLDTPQNPLVRKSVNMWTEISAQGNLLSLCASSTHVWYTDKSCNIWYSALTGPGLTWRKASGYATQVSVSPLGSIVWRVYKGVAYAGTKITTKSPEGLKWVQAVQGDVAYICVDETCAW